MPRTPLGSTDLNIIHHRELSPYVRGKIVGAKDVDIIES